ncbi:MAG: ABC transporter ATP-binding protein [Oscillospiraceae bacterium]|nr:ABC transporter ATP-binding protein [Oscillospiraceae bacterium]
MKLEVKHLSFAYGTHSVLEDISFSVREGEFLSVLGPNGVGKSTLFRCILGLLKIRKGEIRIDGESISQLPPATLARKIAYIPQAHDPVFHYSVFDMVLMGTTAQRGLFAAPRKEEKTAVEEVLEKLGLTALAERSYRTLSGGERQLVLIARAMVQEAKLLLMDEPSASLDFGNRIRVMERVKALCAEGYCVMQSTHDPEQAGYYSDRLLALKGGKVLSHGTPQEVFTEELISALYGVEVEICKLKENAPWVCIPKGVKT